jgi:5-methylcytosine-specific restriction endonuclease McrA
MKKVVIKRVSNLPKTRNDGTMTDFDFWQFIRNALRRKSMHWKPIAKAKLLARRSYIGDNKRQKYEYQCNICKNFYKGTQIYVDHIIPVGSLTNSYDLPHFVETLFCETDNLQVLCKDCHDAKSIIDNRNTKNKC